MHSSIEIMRDELEVSHPIEHRVAKQNRQAARSEINSMDDLERINLVQAQWFHACEQTRH